MSIAERQLEGLNLYEPLPHIEPFHACSAPDRILRGSNQSGKAQPVDELVLTPNGWTQIGLLVPGDVVIGGDGYPCVVTGVYPQGEKPVYRLTFSGGETTRCCGEHLWKAKVGAARFSGGDWEVLSLQEILSRDGVGPAGRRAVVPTCVPWMPRREMQVDPYLMGLLLGDGSMTAGVSFSTSDEQLVRAVKDLLPHGLSAKKRSLHKGKVSYDRHLSSGVMGRNPLVSICRDMGVYGCRAWEKFVPRVYLFNDKSVRLAVLQGLMDTDGTIDRKGHTSFCTTSPRLADNVAFLVRSLGGRCKIGAWNRKSYWHRGEKRWGRPVSHLQIRMLECPFRLERKKTVWEEWRLTAKDRPCVLYSVESDGVAECVCISVSSPDSTYTTSDLLVTHNTLGATVEFARAVTGQDPYKKYPEKDGRAFIVGKDGKHNSEVLYRYLFRPGAFKIVQDEVTHLWRAWRPWLPEDMARKNETVDAPPLIPPRIIKSTSWENKKEGLASVVRLKNGWEIRFFSSLGKPPQGSTVDLAWFDEEIVDDEWRPEISARLIKRNGLFFWSATAQLGGAQLYDLCQEAEEESKKENPRVVEFFAHIDNNRHFTDEQRDLFFAKLNPEQRRIRIEGEFAFTSFKVYPEFDMETHGVPWFAIPDDWTRYMVVDPGRQICAAIFAAVPPPTHEDHDHVYFFDEMYVRNCNSNLFGDAAERKTDGQQFYAFLIDHRGARIRQAGNGKTIEFQYSEALKERKVLSTATGSGFIWGSDDVEAGVNAFRSWLVVRPNGTPKLKVLKDKLPNFEHEISRYHYKREKRRLTDKPEQRNNHLMDCARYLAVYDPKWHKAPLRKRVVEGALAVLNAKRQRERMKNGGTRHVSLGPSNG